MKRIILFILCLLVGLIFINAGLDKFLHYMPVPKDLPEQLVKFAQTIASIGWLLPLVGTMEITGGLLLAIPRTGALGAIVLLPILTGIVLSGISMPSSGLYIVLVILAIILFVIFDNWKKYLPMVSK